MKKVPLILSLLATLLSHAQPFLPPYKEIARHFFNHYSYTPAEPVDAISFAKKKDGWHVQVVDRLTEKSKSEQLFWSVEKALYLPISGFDQPQQANEIETLLLPYFNGTANSYQFFGYERCRYFGYNGWEEDMLKDYGDQPLSSLSDTLLEGLGRSYSIYSSRFAWYQFGGSPTDTAEVKRKLKLLELPSQQRADSTVFYIRKAAACYAELKKRNPAYQTLVGNIGMKHFNELMYGYNQMSMAGYSDLAMRFLQEIEPNETITSIAKNYLSNCPPNSILIAFGDNDTYPLWYVQQAQDYRKDVLVLNQSLLGFAPYIHMLHQNGMVAFSSAPTVYGSKAFEYVMYQSAKNFPAKEMALSQLLTVLQTKKYTDENLFSEEIKATYPVQNIYLTVDPLKLKKLVSVPGLGETIRFKLPNYLTLDQLLILDIIQNNIYKRPICFTAEADLINGYLQQLGSVYVLLPLQEKKNGSVNVNSMENYLQRNFSFVRSVTNKTGIAPASNYELTNYNLIARLAEVYLAMGDSAKAKEWLDNLKEFRQSKFLPGINTYLGYVYLLSGDIQTGLNILTETAAYIEEVYHNPSSLHPILDKATAKEYFSQIQTQLNIWKLESEEIRRLKEKVDKE